MTCRGPRRSPCNESAPPATLAPDPTACATKTLPLSAGIIFGLPPLAVGQLVGLGRRGQGRRALPAAVTGHHVFAAKDGLNHVNAAPLKGVCGKYARRREGFQQKCCPNEGDGHPPSPSFVRGTF